MFGIARRRRGKSEGHDTGPGGSSRYLRLCLPAFLLTAVLAIALAACGSSGSSSSSSSGAATGGSTEAASEEGGSSEPTAAESGSSGDVPTSGEVEMFALTSQNPYIGEQQEGAKKAAEELGWDIHIVEVTESQAQQDSQVTQYLTSGKKPLGIILNPFSGESASASMQAITAAGIPLVIVNSLPSEEQAELYTLYAGNGSRVSGKTAAKILVERAKEQNVELKGGLILGEEPGYTSGQEREESFTEELKNLAPEATVLASGHGKGFEPETGYTVASQLLPKYKGSVTWMYGLNDAIALGGLQALKANGLTPQEVLTVGGTCLGGPTTQAVIDGRLAGTAVQSPAVEGELAVRSLAQYLGSGEQVTPGETTVSAAEPPPFTTAPHKLNFMPNPVVKAGDKAAFEETDIWGRPASELCNYG